MWHWGDMTSTPMCVVVCVSALTDDTPMVPGVLSNKWMTMEPTRATGPPEARVWLLSDEKTSMGIHMRKPRVGHRPHTPRPGKLTLSVR